MFPRKINGKFVMLSWQDDENILIMSSIPYAMSDSAGSFASVRLDELPAAME